MVVYIDKLAFLDTICCIMKQVDTGSRAVEGQLTGDQRVSIQRDTVDTGDDVFSETVTTGIYVLRAQIIGRMEEAGLMAHDQVKDAIAQIESDEKIGIINSDLSSPEAFARAVFMKITGSQAVTNCIVHNLLNDPSETEFAFGDKGLIFNRHYGSGGMSDVLGVYFYGNEETGDYKGVAIAKVANVFKNEVEQKRFEVEKRMMATHSNGDEKDNRGYRNVFAKYFKETGSISLKNKETHEHETRSYYAMELLKGHSLQDVLEEILGDEDGDDGLPLDPQVATDLLVAILIKLSNFKGDIHRDIKPDNIFIRDDGTVCLLDCGLSKEECDQDKDRMTQTQHGPLGTPCYMAPEQLSGGGKGGRKFASDTYSLAASLYEMLHRELPFKNGGEGFIGYHNAHMSGAQPSFSVVSTGSGGDIKNHSAGADSEDLTVLDKASPKLASALRTMLSIKPEDRLAPDSVQDLFMEHFKDGRQTFAPTDKQAKEQFNKWIEELLPSSSFTTDDIKNGNPSVFQSLVIPKERELNPKLQVGSQWTRKEMYNLLTTPTTKSMELAKQLEAERVEAERVEAERVEAERISSRNKKVGWTVASVAAGVGVTIAAILAATSGKKPVDTEDPVGITIEQSDPPTHIPAVGNNSPLNHRVYPGGSKMVFIPRVNGYSYAEAGNDCLYFYNEEFASEDGEDWAEGIETDGALIGFRYNSYHNDADGGFKSVNSDGSYSYENAGGSSAFRSQLENSDFYRTQIGSTETNPNEAPYLSGVRIENYVLCVVDNESESVLYYIGRDGKQDSIVFPNGQECADYLRQIEYNGGTLYDAFSTASFDTTKSGRDKDQIGNPGYDTRGKKLLSGNDHNGANSALSSSINTYFDGSVKTPAEEMLSRPRPYPGTLRQEPFASPRGYSGKIIGNDKVVFFNRDFANEKNSDWANGREATGALYDISFNHDPVRYANSDAGPWKAGGRSAEMMFESADGSSAFRSNLENSDKYRLEIGSLASAPNENTHLNAVCIGDYVLCIVDGESESALYYVGRNGEETSLMFPNPESCVEYLQQIEHGESTLHDAFSAVDFDTSKGKANRNKSRATGFDSRGRPILQGNEHASANDTLRNSITSYFNSTDALRNGDMTQAIADRK